MSHLIRDTMNKQFIIQPSELPINSDGSVFHLHLKPGQISDKIILVGDRERVDLVATFFDSNSIECNVCNREYHAITGKYKGKRLTCISHGIGIGNIDILMTELDALVNVDLNTRTLKDEHTTLTFVRVGTCGSLQNDCPIGSFVVSKRSIGFDGMLNYYELPEGTIDLDFEEKLCDSLNWNKRLPRPYVVSADNELVDRIGDGLVKGCTISAPGFYGPQGRVVRLNPIDTEINSKIQSFDYNGERITNYEMESSGVAGLAKLLGHKAVTVCNIIAGRVDKTMNTNYHGSMEDLIKIVIDRI